MTTPTQTWNAWRDDGAGLVSCGTDLTLLDAYRSCSVSGTLYDEKIKAARIVNTENGETHDCANGKWSVTIPATRRASHHRTAAMVPRHPGYIDD